MTEAGFQDAKRQQEGLLARTEKKALIWFARHVPDRVNSDHLTLLGFLSMFGAGLFYALSGTQTSYLHLVNACLVLNWFGDSLDGTLARYRNKLRPRYGFYVDHVVDTFGALFLLGGLGLSGYMSERMALFLLISFLILSIEVYLATYCLGTFKISYGFFSPTELRALLIVGNFFLLYKPKVRLLGQAYLLFDVGAAIATLGMIGILILSTIFNTRRLYGLEKI